MPGLARRTFARQRDGRKRDDVVCRACGPEPGTKRAKSQMAAVTVSGQTGTKYTVNLPASLPEL